MLNVACVNWGTAYPDKYVNVLYDMVKHYLSVPYKFFCITDRNRNLYPDIEQKATDPNPIMTGWWQKVAMFKPGVFTGTTLFFDLDIIIKGELDFIMDYAGSPFTSIKDFSGLPTYNSSVMIWNPDQCYDIYKWFTPKATKRFHSDQEFITAVKGLSRPGAFFPLDKIVSYKWQGDKLPGASIAVFHGHPKPTELNIPMVNRWWRAA